MLIDAKLKEIVTEREQGKKKIKEYNYEYGWFENHINSDNFKNKKMKNPRNAWPFMTKTLTAQNVTLGKFRLNSAQVGMLGHKMEKITWEDEGEKAIANT